MAENDPKTNDGLSAEEIEQQEVSNLPNREAMSVLTPDATALYPFDPPILDQHLDPSYGGVGPRDSLDPVVPPTA